MRRPLISVLFALLAVSCSGGDDEGAVEPDETTEAQAEGSEGSESSEIAGTANETCGLLSIDEIESAVGRVVIETEDMGGIPSEVFGACLWSFEPLTEGLYAGESPQLVVEVQAGPEYFDQFLAALPDSEVAGIGDGALSRADGEVIFKSNGNSAKIGTLFAYDVDKVEQAQAAAEELAGLLSERM